MPSTSQKSQSKRVKKSSIIRRNVSLATNSERLRHKDVKRTDIQPSDTCSEVEEWESQQTIRNNSTSSSDEDGVEFVEIPRRGRLQTQIFETRTRVHCYFDPEEATWLRLPICWELFSPAARHLVNLVKDVCPTWNNDADILAALRVSNYNVDDCVNTYHSSIGREVGLLTTVKDDTNCPSTAWLQNKTQPTANQSPKIELGDKTSQETSDKVYQELSDEIKSLKVQLATMTHELAQERTIHENLKQAAVQNEKTKSSSELTVSHSHLPGRLHSSLRYARLFCQDVRDILHGCKHLVEDLIITLNPLMRRANGMFADQRDRLIETQALYRQAAQQRRLTYNTLIELRGNIRVFCRIRPMDGVHAGHSWLRVHDHTELCAHLPTTGKRKFQFDQVFDVDATQELVFSELSDIIASSVDGYNVCIMAYGQTGSGKTYTMEGPADKPGVNILSIRELLRIIGERTKVEFDLSMSILEIYNETVIDLLSPSHSCETVEIRHTNTSVSIVGATWVRVKNETDMHRAIVLGQRGRHVAETKYNSSSSRSHLIVSVSVVGTDRVSGAISHGQLTLCDLAGSERIEKSWASSSERFHETTQINLSLSALAQVFVALKNNQLHIPYRNTKLTQMLQPCLGGDAKRLSEEMAFFSRYFPRLTQTCLIVNVTNDPTSTSETLSTLQFGASARQVALGPAKAHITRTTPLSRPESRLMSHRG